MKKSLCSITLYILCVLFSFPLWGQKRVNIEQAEKVAENIASSFTSSGKATRGSKPKLNLVYTSTKNGTNNFKTLSTNDEIYYYVFNVNTNDGFVVVSGNDIAIPVLGYSNEGGYNEKDIPPALAWWMAQYKQEIQYALDHNVTQDKETKAKWADFTNESSQSASPKIKNRSSYTPGTNLVKTKWDQGSPYNDLVKSKLAASYPTGCQATAMAQLMNYWKYPAKVQVSIPSYATRTLNLGVPGVAAGSSIDWANMINDYSSYTPIQAKAVSELMYYAGVSNQMDYTSGGSGAHVYYADRALGYFGYTVKKIEKTENPTSWDAILKAEIDALKPIVYNGWDTRAKIIGHSFICDGYQYQNGILYFHFNWGWGGKGDNYCVTSALIPNISYEDLDFSGKQNIYTYTKPEATPCASPTGLTTTDATANSINLKWNSVSGTQSYTVIYKAPSDTSWKAVVNEITETSYNFRELASSTTYEWGVRANCSTDNSSEYTYDSFNTDSGQSACIPYYEPNGTPETAKLIGPNIIYNAGIQESGDQDYYKFTLSALSDIVVTLKNLPKNYDLKLMNSEGTQIGLLGDKSGTAEEIITINALEAGTYYILVYGVSGDFDTNQCYDLKVAATPTIVCTSPAGLTTDKVMANSADLKWNVVSGAQSYTVEYKTATTSWTPIIDAIITNSYSLKRLTADTTYNWRVKANCSGSISSDYTESSFTTLAESGCVNIYEPNEDLEVATNIVVNTTYNAGIGFVRDFDYYKFILYAPSDIVVSLKNLPQNYDLYLFDSKKTVMAYDTSREINDKVIIMNSLAAGTYYVRVNGYTGYFDLTQCYALKVAATTVCALPTGLYSTVTATAATLNWNKVNGAESYTAEYKPAASSTWSPENSYTADTNYYVFSELTAETDYDWRIKANCSTGDSSDHANSTFVTTAHPFCAPPTELVPTVISATTVSLNWNKVSGVQNYTVEYKTAASSTWLPENSYLINTVPYVRRGLIENTTYNWRVKTVCSSVHSSNYAEGSDFTTPLACIDKNEPNETLEFLRGISINVINTGAIGSAIDKDFFVFHISTISDIEVTLQNLPKNYELKLYDSTKTEIGSSTNSGTTSEIITKDALAKGNYYVQVYGFGGDFDLSQCYELKVKAVATCASPIVADPTDVTVNSAKLNWFLDSGVSSYTVEYKPTAASTWIPVSSSITTKSCTLSDLEAGTVYSWRVKANCSTGNSSGFVEGSFTTLVIQADCIDKYEPNDTRETAHSINLNTTYSAGIGRIGDYDYYEFTLDSPSDVVITLQNLPKDYSIYLYKGGTLLGSSNNSGTMNETITRNALETGSYYVLVYGWSNFDLTQCYELKVTTTTLCNAPTDLTTATITANTAELKWNAVSGAQNYTVEYKTATTSWTPVPYATPITTSSYDLSGLTADTTYNWRVKANCSSSSSSEYTDGTSSFKIPPTCVFAYEDNEAFATAKPISLNTNHSAAIGSATDLDFYKFTISALSNIVVTLQNLPKNYDLKLMNSEGTQIGLLGDKSGTANEIISLNSQRAGTYYVQVYGVSGAFDPTQCYSLKVETTAVAVCNLPTGLSTDNVRSNAINLKWNAVSGAQNYTVEYKTATTSWTPVPYATPITTSSYDLSGLTADTTYNWRVKANCSSSSSSEYTDGTSSFKIPPTCVFDFEDNEAFATAKLISLNTNHSAAIGSATDLDFYKFTISALSNIVVTLQNLPKNYDLKLMNSEGTQIGLLGDKSGTANEIISLNSQREGTYYVQVYGVSGVFDLTQCYSLKVETTAVAVCNPPTVSIPDDVTSNSANLKWNAVSGAQSYTVVYKTSTSSTWSAPITVGTTAHPLQGLTPNTTYNWKVLTNCTTGASSEDATGNFTTLPVCPVPTVSIPDNVTSNSATLHWNSVSGAQSYTVVYKTSTSSTWSAPITVDTTTHPLQGLTPNTTYNWQVRTNCTTGAYSEYATGNFTTLPVCPVPIGLNANATTNSATLHWDSVSGARDYEIEYKSATSGWSTPITVGTNSYTLPGLTAGTSYSWKVRTNCTTGAYSEYATGNFTTPVCHVPTGLITTFVGNNSAMLNWNIVFGAQDYTVEYKTSTSSIWSAPIIVGTNFYRILSGLTANTAYSWQVRTNCTTGASSVYATGNFTTLPVCPVPIGLNADPATNSATLHWDSVSGAQDYEIEYKSATSGWGQSINASTNSYTLPKLTPNMTYSWKVRTNCTTGASSEYVTGNFTTLPVCTIPTVSIPDNVTSNSANLKWNAVSGAQSYTVVYKASTSSTWSAPIIVGTTTHPLQGLTPNTTYNWKVRTNCTTGGSSEYVTGSFTTAATSVCTIPTGLSTDNVMSNSINLKWNAVSGAQNYTVEYKLSTSSVWSTPIPVATTIHPLQGLSANTTYNWRVKANCSGSSSSAYSEVSTFTTTSAEVACKSGMYEKNDTRATAHPINLNTIYKARIENRLDKDYYKFSLSSTSDIVITLENLPKDYDLKLYDSKNIVKGNGTTRGVANEIISLNSQPAGTYYVYIYGYARVYDANQCYTLKVATPTTSVCTIPTGLVPDVTINSANLKWNAVGGARDYTVEYKTSTSSTWKSSAIGTTTHPLEGLTPNTTYNWRVKANCSGSSSSAYSEVSTFTTKGTTTSCASPTGLSTDNVMSNAINLKWNAVSGAQNYTVEYKTSTSSTWKSSTVSTTTHPLEGLTSNTTYNWKVRTNCTNGGNSEYAQGTFTTTGITCATPTGLKNTAVGFSFADLAWVAVSGAQSYTVVYKTSTSSTWSAPIPVSTNSYRLPGLTADTTYNWKVKAICSALSSSDYSEVSTFTTTSDDVACNPNAYESNSYNGNAHLINLNTTYKAGIQKRSDKDFYRFILNTPSDIVVTLKDLPQNYDLIVKNSAGKQFGLLGNKMGTADETITINSLVAGTYYVQVYGVNRAFDENQCYALRVNATSASKSASILNENIVNDKTVVTLYPNPVEGIVNIKGIISNQKFTQLTITDISGGIVKTSQVKVEDIIRIDVSDLSPNVYYLTILGKNFRFIKK